MTKFKKIPQNKQMSAVKSTKTLIMKKQRNQRKKKNNVESLNNIDKNNFKKLNASKEIVMDIITNKQNNKRKKWRDSINKFDAKCTENSDVSIKYPKNDKNNLKKLSTSNKTAKDTVTNMQNNKREKLRGSKNKLDAKCTENLDVPAKYPKDDKNNLKKPSASNGIAKNIITNMQNSKRKKLRSKNKFDVKCTENSNISVKYPKDYKKTSEVLKNVSINTNIKTKHKIRNKEQKQDINLNNANKDDASVDTKKRIKKLQMSAKNLNLERRKMKVKKFEKMNEKRMKWMSPEAEAQQIQSDKIIKINKRKINVAQLAEMLANKSQLKQKTAQLTLRDRMIIQLRASRFRFINEILYKNDSSESKLYFKKDPDAFIAYHTGYKQQIEQWAVNPLDVIISSIKKLPTDNVIADFGCGEARLAASVPHTVYSFDFIALNDKVKACDMAHTPLLMNSVHVVIFCLSLMGSNLNDYIIEANRILKNNGILKIAEVESRFEDVKTFIRLLRNYGFKNTWRDLSHNLFYFMDFKKEEDISMNRKNLPLITLKSCVYKKR